VKTELPFAEESFGPFFSTWTERELDEALHGCQRAPQAHWPALAVVLVLWYWALLNRRMPFSELLYRTWHLVVANAKKGASR